MGFPLPRWRIYTIVQILIANPPSIIRTATDALKTPTCAIAGLPDANHITAGISSTNSNPPNTYPKISLNFVIFFSFKPLAAGRERKPSASEG
jgi:hypothetical protein